MVLADRSIKGVLIAILLICSVFSTLALPQVSAANDLVTVTSTNHGGVTVVEYKNNEGNIFDIASVVLEVDKGGNFKSFKTEKGWIGKRTSEDVITFTTTVPIKPGQSAKFGIKTDQSEPVFKWQAIDEEGDELGSGGKIVTHPSEESTTVKEETQIPSGVLDGSSFKLIPDTPKVGSSLRVIGEGFGPREKLDLYINDNRIDSFVTDEKGAFILSTKVPENQRADRADFIIKDQVGNQKSMSLRIQESSSRTESPNTTLTVNADSVFHRGETKTISGTAAPGSTLTVTLSDSSGKTLTTFTTKADSSAKYSVDHKIPVDRSFGEYTVTVTDGTNTVSSTYTVETTQKITLVPAKQQYDPGETVSINGTAIPSQDIEIIIKDSTGTEVYSKTISVGADGMISLQLPLDDAAVEGTYIIYATQGAENQTFLFGVGEPPEVQLIVRMSAVNYKTTEQAIIYITGPPSSSLSLVIVDPSDKQKFSDSIKIGADGFYQYSFNLNGYAPGVYTAVTARGNAQVEQKFSVGLQTGSGQISIRTVHETYMPGDVVLFIGDSSSNIVITVTLKDPTGTAIKSEELFTDKKGVFTSTSLRIPANAQSGAWTLEAASGVNHVTKNLTVLAPSAEGLAVQLDKSPPVYKSNDIITISGTGAGKSHTVVIKILDAQQNKIQDLSITATGVGSYSTIWKVPPNSNAGIYTIKVIDDPRTTETTFTIQ